jgi:hypothetical protein
MWTRGAQGSRENSHLLPQLPDIDEKFLRVGQKILYTF